MNSDKLQREIGWPVFDAWPLSDSHAPNDRQWHYRRPTEGSPELLARVLYHNPQMMDHPT